MCVCAASVTSSRTHTWGRRGEGKEENVSQNCGRLASARVRLRGIVRALLPQQAMRGEGSAHGPRPLLSLPCTHTVRTHTAHAHTPRTATRAPPATSGQAARELHAHVCVYCVCAWLPVWLRARACGRGHVCGTHTQACAHAHRPSPTCPDRRPHGRAGAHIGTHTHTRARSSLVEPGGGGHAHRGKHARVCVRSRGITREKRARVRTTTCVRPLLPPHTRGGEQLRSDAVAGYTIPPMSSKGL